MKFKAGVNCCPKCGRQRVGDYEYSEEIRTMVFACDVDKTITPFYTLGEDSKNEPQIRVTPAKNRNFSGTFMS